MSGFYVGSSTSSDSGSDLPYPTPLQRSDFLAPNFSPATYLYTLHNRHQTLEDLRAELRSRSQLLSKELLDLVNSNYQDFLGLGRSLKSGDEKVEEVRVGLLGFRKEVEAVRGRVVGREDEVRELVGERVEVRRQIAVGRALVDYEARLALLEGQLMVETAGKPAVAGGFDEASDSEEDESDDEEGAYSMSVSKLRRHVMQYRLVQEVGRQVGEEHPFIMAQTHRLVKVRNTLLLDLSSALQQAKAAGAAGKDRTMKILSVYADMDEAAEAVKVLKSSKTT
ncbi:hypothetical protein K491DRAFT_772421 [Lophiostoma macrostomum CBS 122681]|uniref:Conserved oligomeric Golgi complex subunit 2 n=1 Tax=Lophiostoma macrostomum CBS 122681 TaxID=1314788 RepID=A0A6A6SJQ5_9PLEO|nr:hypothetical protein K491DRAFT_772421 [Lophiostoma macrostomum CBS 122681]